MRWMANLFTRTMLASGLALGAATAAIAQKPASPPKSNHRTASQPSAAARSKEHDSFVGLAAKLNTTPDALESAYQAAKQDNPKVTRGQFVAANMLTYNLGEKNPSITTQAILDGVKGGKSIGQTLQSLGLSAKEAKEAKRQADREAKAAQKQAQAQKPTDP